MTLIGGPLDMDWTKEDQNAIDMDRSIATASTRGCLDKNKTFFINNLTHKLVELGNRKTSARNLSMDKPQKGSIQERGQSLPNNYRGR